MSRGLRDDEVQATRAFYDRISRAYDLISDASEEQAREEGLGLLAAGMGERILEIGFGTGHSLLALAESVGSSGRVVGLDISTAMMEVARDRLEKRGVAERAELVVAPAPPLPFDDGAFDGLFMSFTLELFPEEVAPTLLAECRRVLRPGGRLAVVCMAVTPEGDRDSLLERAYKWMHLHFPHIVDCRPIDVDAVLQAAGFRIVEHRGMEIWTLPVAAVSAIPEDGGA